MSPARSPRSSLDATRDPSRVTVSKPRLVQDTRDRPAAASTAASHGF